MRVLARLVKILLQLVKAVSWAGFCQGINVFKFVLKGSTEGQDSVKNVSITVQLV